MNVHERTPMGESVLTCRVSCDVSMCVLRLWARGMAPSGRVECL